MTAAAMVARMATAIIISTRVTPRLFIFFIFYPSLTTRASMDRRDINRVGGGLILAVNRHQRVDVVDRALIVINAPVGRGGCAGNLDRAGGDHRSKDEVVGADAGVPHDVNDPVIIASASAPIIQAEITIDKKNPRTRKALIRRIRVAGVVIQVPV